MSCLRAGYALEMVWWIIEVLRIRGWRTRCILEVQISMQCPYHPYYSTFEPPPRSPLLNSFTLVERP